MKDVTLGNRFGVNNVIIPMGGPKAIPALLDFTDTGSIEVDGQQVISVGKIEFIQGAYIDNADNAAPLTVTVVDTGQRIVVRPNSQGYYSLISTNPPRLKFETTQGDNNKRRVFFYNVPIQSATWDTE